MSREWEPLEQEKVQAIYRDVEQDCPSGNYCADDVFLLASEVLEVRSLLLELHLELDGVRLPKSAAAILNRLQRYEPS